MAPRKMTMGVDAHVWCLSRFIHPSSLIRDKFPNPVRGHKLDDMIVRRQEEKTSIGSRCWPLFAYMTKSCMRLQGICTSPKKAPKTHSLVLSLLQCRRILHSSKALLHCQVKCKVRYVLHQRMRISLLSGDRALWWTMIMNLHRKTNLL